MVVAAAAVVAVVEGVVAVVAVNITAHLADRLTVIWHWRLIGL